MPGNPFSTPQGRADEAARRWAAYQLGWFIGAAITRLALLGGALWLAIEAHRWIVYWTHTPPL